MLQIQHFLSQTSRHALHRAQWGDHGAADYWQEGGPTPRCSSPHCRGSAPLSAPAGQADSQIHLNPSGSGGECVQKGASLNTQKAALFPCVSSGKVWKGFLVGALMRAYQILSTARIDHSPCSLLDMPHYTSFVLGNVSVPLLYLFRSNFCILSS